MRPIIGWPDEAVHRVAAYGRSVTPRRAWPPNQILTLLARAFQIWASTCPSPASKSPLSGIAEAATGPLQAVSVSKVSASSVRSAARWGSE